MSKPRARTALQRNILIAAFAVGVALGVGSVARDVARTRASERQAKLAAVRQQRMPEGWTEGSSAYPRPVRAPGVDSPAAKPVVIAVVKPWIEIARMPQYVQASSAERKAIRDLYWRICVEDKVPGLQRELAYRQFVRRTTESGMSEASQEAAAPSPVDAETMRRSCNS